MRSIGAYNYNKNKVIINGHVHVSTPAKILQCLVVDGLIILLLDADDLSSDANVYCYNINGELLWVISNTNNFHGKNYFTLIYVLNDLYLYAYNINGLEFKLEYTNGQVLSKEFIK